jgi:hypothetical protein
MFSLDCAVLYDYDRFLRKGSEAWSWAERVERYMNIGTDEPSSRFTECNVEIYKLFVQMGQTCLDSMGGKNKQTFCIDGPDMDNMGCKNKQTFCTDGPDLDGMGCKNKQTS